MPTAVSAPHTPTTQHPIAKFRTFTETTAAGKPLARKAASVDLIVLIQLFIKQIVVVIVEDDRDDNDDDGDGDGDDNDDGDDVVYCCIEFEEGQRVAIQRRKISETSVDSDKNVMTVQTRIRTRMISAQVDKLIPIQRQRSRSCPPMHTLH